MASGLTMTLLAGGVLAPLVYAVGILLAAAGYPGYRHRQQMISELGTADSPRAGLFNVSLGAAGLLLVGFALGVATLLGAGWLSWAVAAGLALQGVAVVLMGGFSCDPGCPNPPESRAGLVHGLSGLLGGLAMVATMGLAAAVFWSQGLVFPVYSLLTGGGTLALLVLLMTRPDLPAAGAWQRLYAGATFAWVMVLGVMLLGR